MLQSSLEPSLSGFQLSCLELNSQAANMKGRVCWSLGFCRSLSACQKLLASSAQRVILLCVSVSTSHLPAERHGDCTGEKRPFPGTPVILEFQIM